MSWRRHGDVDNSNANAKSFWRPASNFDDRHPLLDAQTRVTISLDPYEPKDPFGQDAYAQQDTTIQAGVYNDTYFGYQHLPPYTPYVSRR